MNEHPSKDIVGSDGKELKGKRIVLSSSTCSWKLNPYKVAGKIRETIT